MAYTTINKSTDYFNTKLYTGNASTRSITGVGHQPDMVWTKSRGNSNNHNIYDAVRGATKRIFTNSNSAEVATTNTLTSFDSDGFSLGDQDNVNASGITMASWNWKANGVGSANTDGDMNSTVSVNSTAGFSIVKWTNSGNAGYVGHGLGVVPEMIIIKNLGSGSTEDWIVYHKSNGATHWQYLNENYAKSTTSFFLNTAPTSTKFRVDTDNTDNFIAYCFAPKTGYSKFGSYTGNNNADGTFVYTGFKPAFLMIKYTGSGQNWIIIDNKRPAYNLISAGDSQNLRPNTNDAEVTSNGIDLLSNGFKCRSSDGDSNGYTNPYIYMAFAEAPLVGSNNVPCTAR